MGRGRSSLGHGCFISDRGTNSWRSTGRWPGRRWRSASRWRSPRSLVSSGCPTRRGPGPGALPQLGGGWATLPELLLSGLALGGSFSPPFRPPSPRSPAPASSGSGWTSSAPRWSTSTRCADGHPGPGRSRAAEGHRTGDGGPHALPTPTGSGRGAADRCGGDRRRRCPGNRGARLAAVPARSWDRRPCAGWYSSRRDGRPATSRCARGRTGLARQASACWGSRAGARGGHWSSSVRRG
jgi:hypothetical protein